MPDVKAFIDALGRDVSAVAVPRIEGLAASVNAKVASDYGPRVAAFANQLVKDVIEEQSAAVRDVVTALIQELCDRYRPELAGELRATIVQGGVAITGHDIRLDVTRRDTGAPVSSLDIPVSITIALETVVQRRLESTERRVTHGTFVFVAIDDDGKPRLVPQAASQVATA